MTDEPVDAHRAEQALWALAGRRCAHCDHPLTPGADSAGDLSLLTCPECCAVHCPYCHEINGECAHGFGQDMDGGFYLPDGVELPEPEDLTEEEAAEPTGEQIAEAFGDLLAVALIYKGEGWTPSTRDVFEALIARMSEPVEEVPWQQPEGPLASAGVYYFAPNAAAATAELRSLVDRLSAGFRRLSETVEADSEDA